MNPMIGALRKRNQKLELQNAAMKLTHDRLVSDIEQTESAGCAFVWDLGASSVKWVKLRDDVTLNGRTGGYELFHCPPDFRGATERWEKALIAGANFQEARKWLRDRMRGDKEFRKTAVEACGKDPNMELETPFGRFNVRLLAAT